MEFKMYKINNGTCKDKIFIAQIGKPIKDHFAFDLATSIFKRNIQES